MAEICQRREGQVRPLRQRSQELREKLKLVRERERALMSHGGEI